MKGASIVVKDGGSLTLDGALILHDGGDHVIAVQEGGEVSISGEANVAASNIGVNVYGGEVSISGDVDINGASSAVRVSGGDVTISGGTIEARGGCCHWIYRR